MGDVVASFGLGVDVADICVYVAFVGSDGINVGGGSTGHL